MRLSLESDEAAATADRLFNEANELLVEANSLDDVEGLKSFKQGMRVMRKSARAQLAAISSEVESDIIATPIVDDASAQLEAIALQLNGIRHSVELLGNFRQASREGAGQLRSLADSRDNECASILTDASSKSNEIITRWTTATELLKSSCFLVVINLQVPNKARWHQLLGNCKPLGALDKCKNHKFSFLQKNAKH